MAHAPAVCTRPGDEDRCTILHLLHNFLATPRNALHVPTCIYATVFLVHRSHTDSATGDTEPFLTEDGSLEVPLSCSLGCLLKFMFQYRHKLLEKRQSHERCVQEYSRQYTCACTHIPIFVDIQNKQIKPRYMYNVFAPEFRNSL